MTYERDSVSKSMREFNEHLIYEYTRMSKPMCEFEHLMLLFGEIPPNNLKRRLNYLPYCRKYGAGDGIRTRDINLGKVAL